MCVSLSIDNRASVRDLPRATDTDNRLRYLLIDVVFDLCDVSNCTRCVACEELLALDADRRQSRVTDDVPDVCLCIAIGA